MVLRREEQGKWALVSWGAIVKEGFWLSSWWVRISRVGEREE